MRKLYDPHADTMGFLHYGCFPAVAPKAAVQAEVASCELRALKISKVGGRAFSSSQNLMLRLR